jgi:hypothetical protein
MIFSVPPLFTRAVLCAVASGYAPSRTYFDPRHLSEQIAPAE